MLKKSFVSIITLIAACAAMPVLAAEPNSNFYAVFSLGRSTLGADSPSVDAFDFRNGFTASQTSSSGSSNGGKAQLGYNLGKTFAVEGGYVYLGRTNFISSTNVGNINGNVAASVFNLDLIARFPVSEQTSIFGKFGAYYWETQSNMPSTTIGTTTVNDNGTNVKAGIGLQYEMNARFGVRGEFERYNGIGNTLTSGDSKVNQLTVGAVLKF
jgi:hypothetical protein